MPSPNTALFLREPEETANTEDFTGESAFLWELAFEQGASAKFRRMTVAVLRHFMQKFPDRVPPSTVLLDTILWWLDVEEIRRTGESMSGEEYYIKCPHGPAPCPIYGVYGGLSVPNAPRGDVSGTLISQFDTPFPDDSMDTILTSKEQDRIRQAWEKIFRMDEPARLNFTHDRVFNMYKIGEKISLAAYLIGASKKPTEKVREWAEETLRQIRKT